MGLPLFVPPVESDIPSKAGQKSSVDHVRSPIRRADRRRQLHETREQRLRVLAALQAHTEGNTSLPSAPARPFVSQEESTSWLSSTGNRPNVPSTDRERPAVPRTADDNSPLGERSSAASTGSSDRIRDQRQSPGPGFESGFSQLAQYFELARRYDAIIEDSLAQRTATQTLDPLRERERERERDRERLTNRTAQGPRARYERERRAEQVYHHHRRQVHLMQTPRMVAFRAGTPPVRNMDGLGDRDRSLSPDSDRVWYTLQSTLTPDPQPPSVGSSFASTTASATASQVQARGGNSWNRSMTSPDDEMEVELEPPCDPINDESEGEEDEDADDGGRLEWLSGMHRIVAALASRDDIPDEWWAQAGLSRSMSFGGFN
ncbi:hypothetical protein GGS20DRAFT_557490 [Poronia punctata]|nr:hypothetical protein GGS20DRAFT_557490 [Poronia punctata]